MKSFFEDSSQKSVNTSVHMDAVGSDSFDGDSEDDDSFCDHTANDDDIDDFVSSQEEEKVEHRLTFPEPALKAHFVCIRDLRRTGTCAIDFNEFKMQNVIGKDLNYDKRQAARQKIEEKKKSKRKRSSGSFRKIKRVMSKA